MRREGVLAAVLVAILSWGEIAKGLVGSDVFDVVGEVIDVALELGDSG